MSDLLTRKGALNLTSTLDRVASVLQEKHKLLGIPQHIATDFALRADLLSDAIETQAAANFPLTASDDEEEEEEEGQEKTAAPDFPVEPAEDETGDSVDHGTAGFDANAIGDESGGPRMRQPDENWMSGHFSQVNFQELRDRVESDDIPRLNEVDAKLASLDLNDNNSIIALASACRALTAAKAKAIPVDIRKLPGLSPQQLRAQLDKIADARRELTLIRAEYELVLKKIKGLETEEKEGLTILKKAAEEMAETGKFLAESEKAIMEFTAFVKSIPPGHKQVLDTNTKDPDERAGDFFGRVGRELGQEVGEAVQRIYAATIEDITYTRRVVTPFKVIIKSASLSTEIQKQAGVVDLVVSIKEWIGGKTDALAQRILGFAGDVKKWLRGFVERKKIVAEATGDIQDALAKAEKSINDYMATGKMVQASLDADYGFDLTK